MRWASEKKTLFSGLHSDFGDEFFQLKYSTIVGPLVVFQIKAVRDYES